MNANNKLLAYSSFVVLVGFFAILYAILDTQAPAPKQEHTQQVAQNATWLGTYVRENSVFGANATLTILEEHDSNLRFKLASSQGAHIGNIEAAATKTGDVAVSTIVDSPCTVSFHKSEQTITIQARDCGEFHGARAEFDGVYELNGTIRSLTLAELGGEYPIFRSTEEINTFTQMVKPAYVELYAQSFVDVFEGEDKDALDARVYRGAVPGLSTSMEAIIMIGEKEDTMWAAVIQDNVVVYTTNVPAYAHTLPKTIDLWRERFKDKHVLYLSAL